MTTSATTIPARENGRPGLVATIAIGLVASAAVFGLLISGVVFLAMAVAFEIAVPIAQQYDVSISTGDMAVAARVAELWWIPGGIAIASFLAAAGVALKAIDRVGSDPRG